MSERCKRMSKRTSEWPSTYVLILGCSGSKCTDVVIVVVVVVSEFGGVVVCGVIMGGDDVPFPRVCPLGPREGGEAGVEGVDWGGGGNSGGV